MPGATRAAIWLVCAAPLVWIPGGFDRFVFPKLVLSAAAIGCGALSTREGRLPRPVVVIVAAGVGWFVLACLLSPTPVASLIGRWPRYEGVPVILVYVGSAWLGARLLGRRSVRRVEELFAALACLALALLVLTVLSELGRGVEGASAQARSGSVLGNATEQGLVAMMLLAVLLAAVAARRSPLLVLGAAAAAATVVLSGSRTAALLALLVLAAHAVLLLRAQRRDLLLPLGAGAAGFVALALALPQVRDRLTSGRTISGRLQLWEHGLQVGWERWWAGGPSTFVDASGPYRDDAWVQEVGTANPPDSPHNWLLQAFDSGGVVLAGLSIALAVVVLLLGWRRVRSSSDALTHGAFVATLGYGLGLLPNFTAAGSTCLAAFLVGCLVGEQVTSNEKVLPARAIAGVAMLGVVIFGASALAERSLQSGIVAAGNGDLVRAEDEFARSARLRPFDGDVAMFAAQAYAGAASSGLPAAAPEAARWAGRSLARTPDTYASGLALAVAQIALRDLDRARAGLDQLVEQFPTEPGARIQLGIVKFGQRDVGGARAELRLATLLAPGDPTPVRILDQIDQRVGPSVR